MNKKIRLVDIAEIAGVSVATVSIVLNHPDTTRFTEETKENILHIAEKYNYVPNNAAQELVGKSSKIIALIQPDIENPFFSKLVKILESILMERKYSLLIVNSGDDYKQDIKLIEMLVNRNVAGIILATSVNSYGNEDKINKVISELSIPIILADRSIANFKGSQVVFDNRLGGFLATEYCIANGHKKIGHISARTSSLNGYYRYEGYKDALIKHDIPYNEDYVVDGFFNFESGYDVTKELLKKDVTALVVANDLMAYGAMRKISEQELSIPEDISIVGYDNIRYNDMLRIDLTSVDQDINVLAQKVVDIMFRTFKDSTYIEQAILKPELIIRQSVSELE